MLEVLLRTLGQGGTHSYGDLANTLGVGEELLQQMIEDLARMGYLRGLGDSCQGKCEACPVSGVCAIGSRGQVWSLTEKGSKAAQRME
jgi:hypothetical protein